jgi:FMN phosphatase YigB (HAD superfamily)
MMAKQGKRLFLLTGSPRVWMENVVNFLALGGLFERKFHGEMFGTKSEVFEKLAKEFDPETILSIGDQFETDLKPASDLGMSIFEVKDPSDFKKLI